MNTSKPVLAKVQRSAKACLAAIILAPTLYISSALATPGFAGADKKVCGFFGQITGLLGIASIAVVTIAVIFAGYQIAFAHKRIADVAPILIGGLLIGAAGQIANMLIGDSASSSSCSTGYLMLEQARYYFGA